MIGLCRLAQGGLFLDRIADSAETVEGSGSAQAGKETHSQKEPCNREQAAQEGKHSDNQPDADSKKGIADNHDERIAKGD